MHNGEDDGETYLRERVGNGRRETLKAAGSAGNGGVVWEKSPVFSIQTHRPSGGRAGLAVGFESMGPLLRDADRAVLKQLAHRNNLF